jgi:hypothetical protein
MHTRILAHHEASHAVVAWVLGRPIGLLSIRPGRHYQGVVTYRGWRWPLDGERTPALWRPAILWPARLRRMLEMDICILLAGVLGEQFVDPLSTEDPGGEDEQRAKRAADALAGLTPRLKEQLATLEADEPFPTDDQQAWDRVDALSGREADAHLFYLRAVDEAPGA